MCGPRQADTAEGLAVPGLASSCLAGEPHGEEGILVLRNRHSGHCCSKQLSWGNSLRSPRDQRGVEGDWRGPCRSGRVLGHPPVRGWGRSPPFGPGPASGYADQGMGSLPSEWLEEGVSTEAAGEGSGAASPGSPCKATWGDLKPWSTLTPDPHCPGQRLRTVGWGMCLGLHLPWASSQSKVKGGWEMPTDVRISHERMLSSPR